MDRQTISTERKTSSLKACCDLEYIIIGDLRQLLSEPITPQSRTPLLVLLDRLLQNLPEISRLSYEAGYMSTVLDKCPRMHHQIRTLERINWECIPALGELRDRVESELSLVDISRKTDFKLREWIEAFVSMRYRESQLLQEAFAVDIGGEA